ncbi:zinc ribbon domain-containing protein [Acidobacteriota bacterium]
MKEVLETMIVLQGFNCDLRDAAKKLAVIPLMREQAGSLLDTRQAEYDTTVERQESIDKSRREMEGDLAAIETKMSSYEDKLMIVKSNKEYEAMKAEIVQAQEKAGELETKILLSMEESDRMSEEIKEQKRILDVGRAEHEKRVGELDSDEASLEANVAELKSKIGEVEQTLPSEVLAQYRKTERMRDGIVMARVSGNICGVCRMRIRPQLLAELKRNAQLFNCEVCNRFLYWSLEPLPFEKPEEEDETGEPDGA